MATPSAHGSQVARRLRMWELAAAAGMSTRDARARLEMLGWPTRSHAESVPAEIAEYFLKVVQPLPDDPTPRQPAAAHRKLLRYVHPHARGWAAIVAATLASSVFALAAPWPIKILTDNVLSEHRSPAALAWLVGDRLDLVIGLLALAGLLAFAGTMWLEVKMANLWVKVGQRMVLEIAGDVLRQLQRQTLSFHGKAPVGDLIARVMVDTYGLSAMLGAVVFQPLLALVMSGLTIGLLLGLDAGLTLAAVAVAATMTLTSVAFGRAIRRTARRSRDASGALQSHVHQVLGGLPVVQAFGQETRERRRFRELARLVVGHSMRSTLISNVNRLGSTFTGAVGTAVILWLATNRVLSGSLSLGSLLVFVAYMGTLRTQAGTLAGIYPSLQQSRAAVDRVLEVLDAAPDVVDRPGARRLARVAGRLVFEGVGFSYEPGRPVLQDVSFEAFPGQTVALVGPSGAGKTTLASLVPRFHDPEQGRILLDGHDLRDVTVASLREHVSVVLQEPFLFPISIADNIAYGRPDASREQIEDAARAANAHEFITQLPDGYDSVVGERGATLSGGQRQRISIARALLKDAPLLILDEPTSALDTHSERLLLQALNRLMSTRTTIIIAHRLSTIRNADQILVLDNGRIIERGTHQKLKALGGHYASLVKGRRPFLDDSAKARRVS